MDLQSIYFEINLTENLQVKENLDVVAQPRERIIGELFTGSAVLIDRSGSCLMLNDISISRFIRHLDHLLNRTRQNPAAVQVVEDDIANYTLELRRQNQTLLLREPTESEVIQLEFEAPTFEALFQQKKQNAGTLFWLVYPELEEHAEAEQLRRFFQ